jgi:hypothetical protein
MTLRSENCDSNGGERVLETWFLVLYTERPLTRAQGPEAERLSRSLFFSQKQSASVEA